VREKIENADSNDRMTMKLTGLTCDKKASVRTKLSVNVNAQPDALTHINTADERPPNTAEWHKVIAPRKQQQQQQQQPKQTTAATSTVSHAPPVANQIKNNWLLSAVASRT
jgi:hypothetical protein